MPDLRHEIRARLVTARLEPAREMEIVEEIAAHLDDRHAELVSGGATADEATAAVLAELDESEVLARELGRVEKRAREPLVAGGSRGRPLADAWHDLRYALRSLRKNPGFAAVTILSLAIGIGANTAIFQLLNALHFRPLPVAAPGELARVEIHDRQWAKGNFDGWHPDLSNPLWEQIRARQEAFSAVMAYGDRTFNLSPSGEARSSRGIMVSGDFFSVLGVPALLGRTFTAADDHRGCGASGVVVSHDFWRRELGGDPAAIGRKLSLDGHSFDVIGVTPPGFFGVEVGRSFDVAVPICTERIFRDERSVLDVRHAWWLTVIGRLKPGWTLAAASAHFDSLSAGLVESTLPPSYSPEEQQNYRAYRFEANSAANGISDLRETYTTPLYFLLATAALVLLVACANLANLLLARARAREREIAVRLAVGASRGRLVRQLMVESLLVAFFGAAAALVLARTMSEFLVAFISTSSHERFVPLDPDWRILAFAAGLATLTCLLFGLVPALRAARTDIGLVLKTGGGYALGSGRERFGLRRILVAVQVALSFVLLVGALLFTRSFVKLATSDAGFRKEGVTILEVYLRPAALPPDRRQPFKDRILERIRAVPGVDSAAATAIIPVSGNYWDNYVWLDGVDAKKVDAFFSYVSPGYFHTLGIPLLLGRDFGPGDGPAAPKVIIVSESVVKQLDAGKNPVGRLLRVDLAPENPEALFEIVGVVKDSKYTRLRDDPGPLAYVPAAQAPRQDQNLRIVAAAQLDVSGSLRAAMAEVAPSAIIRLQSMPAMVRETLISERLVATLSEVFGLIAALLASIGLYGVISYGVARRTREIGIRLALGADRRRISTMIIREAVELLLVGLCGGLLLAYLGGKAASSLLYGLGPHDPASLVLAVVVMAVITCVASLLPLRRAAGVDPMTALREE